MFCSVIIPTVGRDTLERAVHSVLQQEQFTKTYELIVVNDSGRPLPNADWQQDPRVSIITTNHRRQCVARNTGAATAQGGYLLFLDDDDWLASNTLNHFSQLAHTHNQPAAISGQFAMVNGHGEILEQQGLTHSGNRAVQLISGCWLQVAAVFLRTDVFFAMGGFSPAFNMSDEIDLFNRVALHHDFVSTNQVVAYIMRGEGWDSTLNYDQVYESNRQARDSALAQPHAFKRLWQSAEGSYWRGRIFRVYAISTLWNLRCGHPFHVTTDRFTKSLAALLLAGLNLFTSSYWRGVRDHMPQEP